MTKSKFFKKIIPGLLIIVILSVGFFGAVDIKIISAQNNSLFYVPDSEKEILGEAPKIPEQNFLKENVNNKVDNTTRDIPNEITTSQSAINPNKKTITTPEGRKEIYTDPKTGEEKDITKVTKQYSCSFIYFFFSYNEIRECVASLVQIVLGIFGWILAVTGLILNKAVNITVIEMGDKVGGIKMIEEGWKIFRDLANIMIIFSLLYIGIVTILNLEGYSVKKLLVSLIIAAIFINFSLFFTKVIIDSSNILSANFYEKIKEVGTKEIKNVAGKERKWGGISDSYMQALRFTMLYKVDKEGRINTERPTIGEEEYSIDSTGKAIINTGISSSVWQMLTVGLLGIILYLITAFSFLVVTVLLIIRYAVLIFLMILSPIALAGMILPKAQTYSKMWWTSLISNSFFAPAYFLLTYIVVIMINSEGFQKAIGFTKTQTSVIYIIINFGVIITFIILTIILSKQIGAYGSGAVMGFAQSARKWGQGVAGGATFGMGGRILRNTVGRGASKWADSEKVKERAARSGIGGMVGRMQLRGLRGVAGSSFDARATGVGGAIPGGLGKVAGKGGYEAKLENQVKKREKFAESLGKESYDEQIKKRGLVLDIKGQNGKRGKQEEYDDAEVTEKNKKEDLDEMIKQNNKKIKDAKEKMDNAKLDEFKDKYKKEYEDALKEAKREQEKLETELEQKTQDKETKKGILEKAQKKLEAYKPGVERQQQYAKTLEEEKTIDTAFIKVSRKHKIASLKIKKNIKGFKEKQVLDYITKAIKENEDKTDKNKPEDKSNATA